MTDTDTDFNPDPTERDNEWQTDPAGNWVRTPGGSVMFQFDAATREATRTRVIETVESGGASRLREMGQIDDCDFFAGAMYSLIAVGWQMSDMPASWTLGLMFGNRSPLDAAFEKLTGFKRMKGRKRRHVAVFTPMSETAQLREALTECLDFLESTFEGDAPKGLLAWRKLLKGGE